MTQKIAIYAPDSKMPNYAIMKVSAYHKEQGDTVEWYTDLWAHTFDKVYCSKIFNYTPMPNMLNDNCVYGGSGYNLTTKLPENIENIKPDYTIYPNYIHALGFLTRGCIRKCNHCIVPEKEGKIRPYRDIGDVLQGRKTAVLLDNNILACEYGIKQIEKIIKLKIKVDFNQGLDCRLIDDSIAQILSRVKWLEPIRLACDSLSMIDPLIKATRLLRWYNCKPSNYFVYVLVDDIDTAIEILKVVKGLGLDPFAQPYRDREGNEPTKEQKDLARWVNHKAIFKSVLWEDYGKITKTAS